MDEVNIKISIKSVVGILSILAGIWVVFMIHQVLLIILLALVLAISLEPFVAKIKKKNIPHVPAVLMVVGVFVLLFLALFIYAFVPFYNQIEILLSKLPYLTANLVDSLGLGAYYTDINKSLFEQIIPQTGQMITLTIGIFNGVIAVVTALIFVIYILIDLDNLRNIFISFFKAGKQKEISILLKEIELKIGGWFRGQVTLMLIIGTVSFIGLTLLGVDYALALAALAGLLEIIPIIGPGVALVPAAIIGFNEQPILGVGVVALYLLIQQLENMYLVPRVMKKLLGFNPLYTIIALMVGVKMFGFIGAILSIPVSIILFEVVQYVFNIDLSHLTKKRGQFTNSPDTAGK